MKTTTLALAAGLIFTYSISRGDSPGVHTQSPAYTAEGHLIFPADYRSWIFLSAGLDMNYSEGGMQMSHHMLDNVFVNPAAYKSFLATGTWPDGTILVKENRRAETEGSINKSGQFETTETMGIESTSRMWDICRTSGGFSHLAIRSNPRLSFPRPPHA